MASIISAGTTSATSLNISADTSGVLQLASNNGTTAVTVDAAQNVGIGTSSPARKLDVAGSGDVYGQIATSNGGAFFNLDVQAATPDYKALWGTVAGVRKWGIGNYGTSASDVIAFYTGGATERARIDSSGNLLVGRMSLGTASGVSPGNAQTSSAWSINNGTNMASFNIDRVSFNAGIYYVLNGNSVGVNLSNGSTSWGAQSDERTKDIIEPITNAAEKVATLRAVIGKYKTDNEDIRRSFLIAQDVQAVLPEAVSADNKGVLNLRYTETIPLLVAAIQELKAELDTVKAELSALKG
jgi:hypothetical protein